MTTLVFPKDLLIPSEAHFQFYLFGDKAHLMLSRSGRKPQSPPTLSPSIAGERRRAIRAFFSTSPAPPSGSSPPRGAKEDAGTRGFAWGALPLLDRSIHPLLSPDLPVSFSLQRAFLLLPYHLITGGKKNTQNLSTRFLLHYRNRISFTRESSKFIAIFYIAHIR